MSDLPAAEMAAPAEHGNPAALPDRGLPRGVPVVQTTKPRTISGSEIEQLFALGIERLHSPARNARWSRDTAAKGLFHAPGGALNQTCRRPREYLHRQDTRATPVPACRAGGISSDMIRCQRRPAARQCHAQAIQNSCRRTEAMKKRFLKSRPVCKVTFELPAAAARDARSVLLVGDFNGWDGGGTAMKRRRDGSYSITLDLDLDREYQFRYLINGRIWENDWAADRYLPSPVSDSDNSVVVV